MKKLPVKFEHLSYAFDLERRNPKDIDLVVIHCTELPDLQVSREYGEKVIYPESGTGNSGHYYIERSGQIHQWVPVERVAHHVRGFNDRSIGIELINNGRYPHWFDARHQEMREAYGEPIIEGLLDLLAELRRNFSNISRIAGHEDLDDSVVPSSNDPAVLVPRKRDPGPLFPWNKVLRESGMELFKPQG